MKPCTAGGVSRDKRPSRCLLRGLGGYLTSCLRQSPSLVCGLARISVHKCLSTFAISETGVQYAPVDNIAIDELVGQLDPLTTNQRDAYIARLRQPVGRFLGGIHTAPKPLPRTLVVIERPLIALRLCVTCKGGISICKRPQHPE